MNQLTQDSARQSGFAKAMPGAFSNRRKQAAADCALFFVLLATPYVIFADHNTILFNPATAIILCILALLAGAFATMTNVTKSCLPRVLVATILVFLFVDIHFSPETIGIKTGLDAIPVISGEIVLATSGTALFIGAWYIRQHINAIAGAVFATILVSTVIMASVRHASPGLLSPLQPAQAGNAQTRKNLPVYVHILLDEQLGLAGFDGPASNQGNIRQDMRSLLTGAGFRTYSRAYSPFLYTNDSVPAMFNFLRGARPDQRHIKLSSANGSNPEGAVFQMRANAYFDSLRAQGYRLNIYQSKWLDYCNMYGKDVSKCTTYNYTLNDGVLRYFSLSERLQVVFSAYANQSYSLTILRYLAHRLDAALHTATPRTFETEYWDGWIGPPVAFAATDSLAADLARARPGEMYFAHLLLPHHPYTVDDKCNIKRPIFSSWAESHTHFLVSGHTITKRDRFERYANYIPQVRCAMQKMNTLFAALKQSGQYEDAIIVIHGDHGSRLYLHEPIQENVGKLSDKDYFDSFSALFTVKMPGVKSGVDPVMVSLPDLLRQVHERKPQAGRPVAATNDPVVFLYDSKRGAGGAPMRVYPMPALPRHDRIGP